MFEVSITDKTLDEIDNYIENGIVYDMNKAGLSIAAMSFVLSVLSEKVEETRKIFNSKENK